MIEALILIPEITKGMKSVGSKALLEIKNKTSIIEYQIQYLQNIDKNIRISIATGFESDRIIDALSSYNNINFIYNPNYKNTNQAASIKLYLNSYPNVDNLLLISSGVLLRDKSIVKSMLSGSSKLFTISKEKENFELGCSDKTDLEYIFYDLPEPWSECVYLNKDAIGMVKYITDKLAVDQMYLFEILNEILNKNIVLTKQVIDKKNIMKIINQKDVMKAKLFL